MSWVKEGNEPALMTTKEWSRIYLPMQGTWVQPLVHEDSTCHGATKPVQRSYQAHAPRATGPQQEKPPQ